MAQSIRNMSFVPNCSFLAIPFFACACWAWHLDASSAEFILSASGCCCCVIGFACSTKMKLPRLFIRPHDVAYCLAFLAILFFADTCWAWKSGASQVVIISKIVPGSFFCVIGFVYAVKNAMTHRSGSGTIAVDSGLFDDPPARPDCGICLLPMPLRSQSYHRMILPCCGKEICGGCFYRIYVCVDDDGACPFCRSSITVVEKMLPRLEERVKRGDARAMVHLAMYYEGEGVELSTSDRILELYHRAAALGNARACYFLGVKYAKGKSVVRDQKMARKYFILAIKQGHIHARHKLGTLEYVSNNVDLAVRHWRISAAAGCADSIKGLDICLRRGVISKASFVESNRAFNLASEAMQSDDRSAWSSLMENSEEPQSNGNALIVLNIALLLLAAVHTYHSVGNKWLLPTLEQLPKSE